jgi:hypothetical protein
MNERIRDLKEQALIWAIETLDPYALNDNEWAVAIDEKFAELIVKECAEVLDETISPPSHPMNSIGYRLKEHFGIKE